MSVQQVRFTLEEHARVRKAAERCGETTSEFVRRVALERVGDYVWTKTNISGGTTA